jgi:hypothetical protein
MLLSSVRGEGEERDCGEFMRARSWVAMGPIEGVVDAEERGMEFSSHSILMIVEP